MTNATNEQEQTDIFQNNFVIPKPNTQEAFARLESKEFPAAHLVSEAQRNLIQSINDFSKQYEDEGTSFNEIKMELAILRMLTNEFKKNTYDSQQGTNNWRNESKMVFEDRIDSNNWVKATFTGEKVNSSAVFIDIPDQKEPS